MVHAIFNTHQTSAECAGVCACNCMHQMEKNASGCFIFKFVYIISSTGINKSLLVMWFFILPVATIAFYMGVQFYSSCPWHW